MTDDPDEQPRTPPDHGAGAPVPPTGRGLRPTTWIALGSTLNGLAAFAFQVVGTRALGAADYAPIGVLWTLQYLWIAVAVTALEAYVTRLVTTDGTASPALTRFLRLFGRWLVAASVATALLGVLLREALFDGAASLGVVLGLVVLGYGWYGAVRGRAAGDGRFQVYGLATIAESVLRLVAAVAVLAVVATTVGLAWVFPLGPLAVGVWAWASERAPRRAVGRRRSGGSPDEPDRAARLAAEQAVEAGTGRRFMAAASTANAAVQFLLAGGPIVLLPLGADPVSVAVFFTTITAARVPMTFALNGGLSRVLPPLTRLWADGDHAGLRRISRLVVAALAGASLLAALSAALVGPAAMELVFGAEFRPGRAFVVVVALGTVLAVGGLLLDQVYIAMQREARLPRVWLAAVALAGVLVLALPGSPTMRVAVAFTAATAAAVTVLSVPLVRGPR